jgi:undecaprenyl-diphosphatase
MIENIILGIVQGIAEWLPVSSEGLIILIKTNVFNEPPNYDALIKYALFLHLGTFLAAFVYFRKDVFVLIKAIFSFKSQTQETKKIFSFLFVTTLISGSIGLCLLKLLSTLVEQFETTGKSVTLVIGCLLLVTAFLELRARKAGYRNPTELKLSDAIITGIAQGMATLPGLSRSGLTMSTLLLLKFDKQHSLRLSFLLSLPIVLAGNIILNFSALTLSVESLLGLAFSFIFGLLTIHILLKIAKAINFGYFMLLFGTITILSYFL